MTPIQPRVSTVKKEPASATKTNLPPPKKRVSRACDECRLHKARCDGATTCDTCVRYSRVCSYNLLPVECKGSAARIKILEHRLVKARECITDLRNQLPQAVAATADLDQFLAPQRYLTTRSSPSATSSPSRILKGAETDLTSSHPPNSSSSCFISSLLQPLSHKHDVQSLLQSDVPCSILCGTYTPNLASANCFCHLPAYGTMMDVVYSAFRNIFAIDNLVSEQDFRVRAQRLYDINPVSYTPEDVEFIPLFCALIALGMIHCSTAHHQLGYDQVTKESLLYFEAASTSIAHDRELNTPIQLQTALCVLLYLLDTSKLDAARQILQGICATRVVQGLLQSGSDPASRTLSLSEVRQRDVLWTIVYLDLHLSTLLGSPSSLHDPGPELDTIRAINTAAQNVAAHERSDTTFLLSVSIAMAIELMRLVQRIPPITAMMESQSPTSPTGSFPILTGVPERADLEVRIHTWEFMFHSIFPENDCDHALSLVRHQLQCDLYLAQIKLYHNSLPQCANSWHTKGPSQISRFSKGRACIAAATNAITSILTYQERLQVSTTLTWHSANVLFTSALTLLIATSFADPEHRHILQQSISTATRLLTDSTYGSAPSKNAYLRFIQTCHPHPYEQEAVDQALQELPISSKTPIDAEGIPFSFSSGDASTLVSPNIGQIRINTQDQSAEKGGSISHVASTWSSYAHGQQSVSSAGWGFDHS